MAESKPTQNTKDLTECGICLCTIEEPKALPCLHTYCLKCLSKWAEGKTDTIRCPGCVQDFDIPSDGIKGFRTNFFINTLKDRQSAVDELESKDTTSPCASCGTADSKSEAYCSSCSGFICGHCVEMHKRMKACEDHKVTLNDDLKSGKEEIGRLLAKKFCKVHEGQIVWFFCETCETLICRDCTVVDHPASSHTLVNLETVTKGLRKDIEYLIERCQEGETRAEYALGNVDRVLEQLVVNSDAADAAIDESYHDLLKVIRNQLEAQRNELKAELKKTTCERKKQLEIQREEIQTLQTRISTVLQMATEVVRTGSDYDLALIYASLKTNLTELGDLNLPPVDKWKAKINFEPAKIGQDTVQKIGAVVAKERKEGVDVWILESTFGDTGAGSLQLGRGAAVTQHDHIAVADYTGHAVKVYDKSRSHRLTIDVPGFPYNVVSSANGILYVASQTQHVYAYDDRVNQLCKFPTKSPAHVSSEKSRKNRKPSHAGLAIDNQGYLLVGEVTQNYISKHKLDGTHITSFHVPTPPEIIAVTPEDRIIMSAGFITGPGKTSVVISDSNGSLLHNLDRSTPLGIITPCGVCCTSGNQIYVSNNKCMSPSSIECYSAETGAYIGCVTKDVIEPAGLLLTDNGERLIVVETSCIKIFQLQH